MSQPIACILAPGPQRLCAYRCSAQTSPASLSKRDCHHCTGTVSQCSCLHGIGRQNLWMISNCLVVARCCHCDCRMRQGRMKGLRLRCCIPQAAFQPSLGARCASQSRRVKRHQRNVRQLRHLNGQKENIIKIQSGNVCPDPAAMC